MFIKEQIKNILIDKTSSSGNRLGNIKEIFKNLINDDKKILDSFNVFDIKNDNFLTLSITLIRKDEFLINILSYISIKKYIN